jgi:hypothetical protein
MLPKPVREKGFATGPPKNPAGVVLSNPEKIIASSMSAAGPLDAVPRDKETDRNERCSFSVIESVFSCPKDRHGSRLMKMAALDKTVMGMIL